MDQLKCFLDGDMLAIVKNDFVNLEESEVIWISLSGKECIDIERMILENKALRIPIIQKPPSPMVASNKGKPPKPQPVTLISIDGKEKPIPAKPITDDPQRKYRKRAPLEYPPTYKRKFLGDLANIEGMGNKERMLFQGTWLTIGLLGIIVILALIARILWN